MVKNADRLTDREMDSQINERINRLVRIWTNMDRQIHREMDRCGNKLTDCQGNDRQIDKGL